MVHVDDLSCILLQCKCNGDNKVKKVTKMGCENCGFAFCPRLRTLYCKDGTLLDRPHFFQYMLEGRKGCICKDGIMPRCEDTDDVFKCPDGSDVDWRLGGPQEFRDCKVLGPKLLLPMGCVKVGEKNCVHLPFVGKQTAI